MFDSEEAGIAEVNPSHQLHDQQTVTRRTFVDVKYITRVEKLYNIIHTQHKSSYFLVSDI